jgi:hypothetical protein
MPLRATRRLPGGCEPRPAGGTQSAGRFELYLTRSILEVKDALARGHLGVT